MRVRRVRCRTVARRQQRIQLHLRVGNGVADGEPHVAQSGCSNGDQQGLDDYQPRREIGEAGLK